MLMKAFRLNEYEKCSKVDELFRPSELLRVTVLALGSLNCITTRGLPGIYISTDES